ncbi:MAG: hypothetical protein VX463_05720, partial [Pseudomonadota bacterium]|nr:hypothetical protein [Pseudomonadota bacterium]
RALRGPVGAPPRPVHWDRAPAPGTCLPWLLPPALAGQPPVAIGWGGAEPCDDAALADLTARLRREGGWWTAVAADAPRPRALADLRGRRLTESDLLLDLLETEAGLGPAHRGDALALAEPGSPGWTAARARGIATAPRITLVDPARLELAVAGAGPLPWRAALVGLRGLDASGMSVDPGPWARRLRFVCPWRGVPVTAEEGLAAMAFLRRAAQANDRRVVTAGLSGWKRRNVTPFLAGPAGPPQHRPRLDAALALARAEGGRVAVWGVQDQARAAAGEMGGGAVALLHMEDGFVRSVGLGLRHAPPASLAIDREALYFDATRPTDFERLAAEAAFDRDLLDRARALRARLIALRITKYNLHRGARPPEVGPDRFRLLVPGQVEGDASLRFGSPEVATNEGLLRAARARHPEAFILYKPHPDVLTGMRPGAVPLSVLEACADATAPDASAEACLDWADGVETMTSLMGFEALLRGKAVACHGRPFYHGWGLTEAAGSAPFHRARRLSLDELTAVALILYPRYVDPRSRLPAPPERALDWLDGERAFARTRRGRLRDALRAAVSRALNFGRR